MYHIRILDRDRQIQAILPDVQWSYTRRINQATEISVQIPREVVDEHITPEHPLYRYLTRPDKGQYAEIAAFVQVYQGTSLRATGCITGREIGQTITVKALTEEILLESNITPAQYGRVWDGWDLADVAKDLLNGWRSIRVKAQSQWQSYMVASSNVDLNTEPGVVMLAKQANGRYCQSGYITLLFGSGEIKNFVRWDRVRWSADSNDVVQTSIQVSYDGSNWSQEIDGGLPEEIGYYLGGSQGQVYVRINLSTTDTESEDPDGNPVGVTPYVFAVELIARTEGHLVAGNIPDAAGVTVKGLNADHANALQVLIDACEQNGWEFAVWNGALSIAQALGANRTADFVLRGGTNMEITSLGDDDSELCNILTAYGPGQGINRLEVTLRDDESIGAYGDYPQAVEFDVASLDELEQAAQAYLDSHNTPKTHFAVRAAFDCESEPDYGLGDVVRVADPDTGIITTTRIMTESREYSDSGLSVRLDLGRARLNLQSVLDGRERLPKPVDPLTPVGVYARGVFKGLVVGCSEPKGSWSHTECHISTAKGFVPSSSTLVTTGRQTRFDIPNLAPGVRYYARLVHIDSTGRRSDPSREVSAVTQYIRTEDLDQAPPDTPVWDTCEFVREIVLRWHPAARAAEYEIRESDSGWGEAAGQVWRGNATTTTLAPTKRNHTYYIRAISAAGVYSLDAAPITLTNATPSTPPQPTVQEFFSCLWITINPVADNDITHYNLYMTPVDEEGDPTGDTQVTTYLSAGRITYNASPGTKFRVEVTAADVLGEGSKSAPVFAATATLADADIPDGIITESHLTESLREAIEESDLGDIPHRLEVVESELDPDTPGSVRSQVLQLADEITLKVQRRADGRLVVTGIGVAVDDIGQSEVAVLADRFRVLTSTDGEMKSVFAVDSQQGKVYILGDMIAEGLIRAEEVHTEIAKALLLSAQVATIDDLDALRIRAESISVSDGTPLFDEDGKLDADAGGIKAVGSQITLDSTGLKMRRAGESIDRAHLDARRLLFRDPASGAPTVGMGWVHDVVQEIDPEADPDDLIKYGIFINQGEIRASQSVLRQSLTDYSVGQQHIEDGSVTLRKLGSALSVSIPDRMMLIYHKTKSFSTNVTEDVIVNWSFEMGDRTGWTGTGTVENPQAQYRRTGSYALRTPRNFYQDVPVSAYVGMTYRARVYARSISSSRLLRFTITYLDASHTALGDPIVREYQVTTNWYVFSIIGEIPDGVAYLRYTLHDVNNGGSNWDDALLEVAEIPHFEYTIPAEECAELLRIELGNGPWVVWINGEEVLQTSSGGASSADIDVRAFDGDLHIVARKPSPTFSSETMKLWINERLPVRGAVPRYSIASCDGTCQSTCQLACQGTCETGCQAACESACQTSCQRECQSTCQESCQQACQTSCQSTCEKTSQGGGGCWVAGTPVSVYDPETGEVSEIPVEQLRPGVLMPYYDPADDSIKTCECLSNDVSYTSTIYVVEVEGGYRLEATGEQPLDVLRQEHWHTLAVRFLRPGDKLVRPYDGTLHDILSVTREVRAKTVVFNPRTTSGRYIVQGFSDQTKVVD